MSFDHLDRPFVLRDGVDVSDDVVSIDVTYPDGSVVRAWDNPDYDDDRPFADLREAESAE